MIIAFILTTSVSSLIDTMTGFSQSEATLISPANKNNKFPQQGTASAHLPSYILQTQHQLTYNALTCTHISSQN